MKYGKYFAFALVAFLIGAVVAVINHRQTVQEETTLVSSTEDNVVVGGSFIADAPEMPNVTGEDANTAGEDDARKDIAVTWEGEMAEDETPDESPVNVMPGGWKAEFSLVDQNGKVATADMWPGKYLAVFFGFTNCPDICPVTLEKMTTVFENTPDLLTRIQPLFVTVDPARDTQEVMKAYMANYNSAILGLTGTQEQVNEMVKSFNTYVAKGEESNGAYLVNHMPMIYMVSPERDRANFVNTSLTPDDMTEFMFEITSDYKGLME